MIARHLLSLSAVLQLAGCGMLLKHAKPEDLATLPESAVVPLAKYEDERLRIAAAWQFAKQEQAIAEAELAAISAKRGIAEDLVKWVEAETTAARDRRADERVASLGYCKNLYQALADLHAAERHLAKAAAAAATARSREQQRLYALAEVEQERAKIAAVTDRPGVLKEDREKILARWSDEVARQQAAAQKALIARRQAEVRASDAQAALLAHTSTYKNRFGSPCLIDWALPEGGQPAPRRQVRNPGKLESASPLSLDEALDDNPSIEIPNTRPAPGPLNPFPSASTKAVPLEAAEEAPMLIEE